MVTLNRTPRTYFDHICTEYGMYPLSKKLLDIGYATWHGHDIMEDIRHILDNYPDVSEDNIRFAIHTMLAWLNHCSAIDYHNNRRNIPLESEVKTLIQDLMKVYRLPVGNPEKAYLAEDPSRIYFRELSSMNGWIEALKEDRQPYQMFSDGYWIMFPGDGEIIRNYNLSTLHKNKGYLSYVYPEPWYGSPTSAKLIVLGNEARYSYRISYLENLGLTQFPSFAESVQVTVDGWLELRRGKFYDCKLQEPKILDMYNSPTYKFWLKKITEFADFMVLPGQKVFDNIAVINANPYTAMNVRPIEAGLLPSHYFLRQLVRYIVCHNPDVLFLLPSEQLRPVWQQILGDVYEDISTQNRLLKSGSNNSISLTGQWNTDQNDRIYELIPM